MYKKTQIFSCL